MVGMVMDTEKMGAKRAAAQEEDAMNRVPT